MVGSGWFAQGCGFVGMTVLASAVASSALADSLYLKNGQVIEGKILKGTLNTLTLSKGGSLQLASFDSVERVVIDMADGSKLAGVPLSWIDGMLELRSDGDVVRVADGVILEEEVIETETATTEEPAAGEPAEVVSIQGLPSFAMTSGETMVGEILHATGSVLTIRSVNGSARPLSRAQVESVSITDSDGADHSGELLDWDAGVYRLKVGEHEVLAGLGVDAQARPSQTELAQEPAAEAPEVPVAAESEQADAAALPASTSEPSAIEAEPAAASDVGAGGPVNETAVAALSSDDAVEAADPDDQRHHIETLVDAIDEDGENVVVKFQLSKPATRPLVVLYAATEASAKAGEDFEAKSGVITFSTGSSNAEVQVPIIDDGEGEESETFNLFLSGDPESIAFGQRQIAVTINDND
jgi:hypothetical protein